MRREIAAHKRGRRVGAWCVSAVLAGILASATPALADDASGGGSIDSVLKMLNLKADRGQVPDFVETSRPKVEQDYLPVGTQHPSRPIKVKSAAEIKASEAELDAARFHQDQISGRPPPPGTPAPVPAKQRKVKTAPATTN